MELILDVFFFWAGAIFGSFAGAMAWRLKESKKTGNDRSECEKCHHKLGVADLMPVVSWLLLQGRCRYCHRPIGRLTLAIELLTGLTFLASFLLWPYGFGALLPCLVFGLWLICLVLLSVLFVYDWRWGLLPNKLIYPLIFVSLAFFVGKMLIDQVAVASWPLEILFGLLPITGIYGVLYLVSKGDWVGDGDVRLGVAIGLLLGWQGAWLVLILSNLLGFIYVLPGLLSHKLNPKSRVPFGPFLILATVVTFFAGKQITALYLSSFLGG